jgi:two-component system, chemotaxis family, chemotaxis protein CheY
MTDLPLLLVVDDDPSVLLLVDVLAERLGFRVKAVSNGLQALEQLRDGLQPAVILLDMMMDRIDGPTFISHLREMKPASAIPVIAMSTPAVLERHGDTLDVSGTLMKPITQAALAAALERYR